MKKETTKVADKRKQKQAPKKNISPQKTAQVAECIEDPIYVGQLEMAALQMQDEMQKEVSKSWQPPAGLPKHLQCTVRILIDWNGKPREAMVEKPSGVLMYDISARTAISQLQQLPRWAHGKEFTITFKQ